MIKHLTILLICLIAFSASQTCGEGQIKNMQTGLIELGLPTTSFAQKQYTVTFKRDLGVYAQVFHAFALAGFQGSCTQDYYSLVVDRVYIQNRNTKMRFEMDYNYGINSTNYISQWTKVKLTWIVVTNQFESFASTSGGSYVWVGSSDISVNNTGLVGIFGQSSIFGNISTTDPSSSSCGYLSKNANNLYPRFDTMCATGDQIVAHYYIMGFKFNPANSTTKLAVSALINDYTNNINKAVFGAGGSAGYGPVVSLNNYGGALKRIKVSVVLTTLRSYSSYPASNIQIFGYSGVYMPIDLKNQDRPIIKTDPATYNRQKYDLPKITYQIYGLSSFNIAQFDKCSSLDVNMQIKDFYTTILQTDNTDNLTNVFISADFYSKNTAGLCSGSTGASRQMYQISSNVAKTVPDLKLNEQNIQQTSTNPITWKITGNQIALNGSKLITYDVTMNYENFIIGNSYKFQADLFSTTIISPSTTAGAFSTAFAELLDAPFIRWTIQIDNQVVYDKNINTTADLALLSFTNTFGLIIQTTKPKIRFTVTIPRPVKTDYVFSADFKLAIQQYTTVYNPKTDCCIDKCPLGSALNLKTSPPSCTSCQGDSALIFDSVTGTCNCKVGFYNVLQSTSTGKYVCFPCLANLCGTCSISTPTKCTTCVVGALLDSTNTCKCLDGFYQINGTCTSCPAKCLSCSVGGVCNNCSNSVRILNQNCDCPSGLYDDGSSTCKTCNPICKTCNSSTTCTSCFTENNRTLINGQCVCSSGFYQIINSNNTVSCRKCNPECKQCSGLNICIDCNANQNRISGYDQFGRQTCLCKPGYAALKDGSCVQTGCTADPFCQSCDKSRGVSVCIQCLATSKRILSIPQYKCVCQQGTYQSQGQCISCPIGCSRCSNATVCQVCAVSATRNNNGGCSCPESSFFAVQPIRFCKKCNEFCLRCNGLNSCDQCRQGFSATTNGECICNRGKYIDSNLQCVSCQNNCASCSGQNNCTLCASGFYIQNGACVTRCAPGFYNSAVACEKCQDGCSFCQRPGACSVCDAGRYSYNGLCYINCPAGSVADNINNTCITCNSPCKTCVQHPSKCLSCLPGLYFFQNTCRSSCPVGSFNNNGVCQYCDFDCLTCVGSKSICTACPANKFMFEGNCYSTCPVALVNGKCPNICPNGYYTSGNNCLKCNTQCITCKDSGDFCLNCVSGFANNGVCVQSCPNNKINVNGNCISCAQGCNGCSGTSDTCLTCQSGYFLSGSKCVASCAPDSFRDVNNGCQKCSSTCKTCTSTNFCTSCIDTRSQPINGICYACIYPCSTCSDYDKCTNCLSGFNLYDNRCVSSCPQGSNIINGVCKCSSGFFQNGNCVKACASGFTNINDNCQACSSECAECSNNINACTSCKSGFVLNGVTGKCQTNTNCQYGEYYSKEDRRCKRICPIGTSFQDSVCLTQCLQGFVDNSFGGCVKQGIVSGCSFPYFYQQGVCVSTCIAGSFPNSLSRVCQACSSNCFACFSSAFCLSCRSGFDLKDGICISGQRCSNNKLKYNGICVDTCPVGTLPLNGYCQRRCDPNFYFFDGRCYSICPSNLIYRTDVACVSSCPSGFILQGKVCKLYSQSCPSGQFYNTQNGLCSSCSSSCSECLYTPSFCNSCPSGTVLSDNKCIVSNLCGSSRYRLSNGQCATCPVKCSQCVSATQCSACASGYVFNGWDCIVRTTNLNSIQITQSGVSRREKTLFVSVKLSIIPNGLSNDQKNKFFIVIPSSNDRSLIVNQWISQTQANTVIVAVQYETYPQSSTLFLALNAALLSSSYANVGYTANENSFLTVTISGSVNNAPLTLIIPSSATNSIASTERDILPAQQTLKKAIKQKDSFIGLN